MNQWRRTRDGIRGHKIEHVVLPSNGNVNQLWTRGHTHGRDPIFLRSANFLGSLLWMMMPTTLLLDSFHHQKNPNIPKTKNTLCMWQIGSCPMKSKPIFVDKIQKSIHRDEWKFHSSFYSPIMLLYGKYTWYNRQKNDSALRFLVHFTFSHIIYL